MRKSSYIASLMMLLLFLTLGGCSGNNLPQDEPTDPQTVTVTEGVKRDVAPAQSDSTGEEMPPRITTFLERWNRLADDDHKLYGLKINDSSYRSGIHSDAHYDFVTFAAEWIRSDVPGIPNPNGPPVPIRVHIYGAAGKDTGLIYRLRVHHDSYGPAFTEERFAVMWPLYEMVPALMDPTLSASERSEMLRELKLVGNEDPEALREDLRQAQGKIPLIRNGISYNVSVFGSEEGDTVALEAVIPD